MDDKKYIQLRQMYDAVLEASKPLLTKQNMSSKEKQYVSVARNVSEMVSKYDPLYTWAKNIHENSDGSATENEPMVSQKLMKNVADVQVMDFITGNIDRQVGKLCDKEIIRKYREKEANDSFSKSQINYIETKLNSEPPETLHERTARELREMSEELERNTPFLHWNSGSYNKMKKALNNLRTSLDANGSVDAAYLQLKELNEACQNYVNDKDALPKTEYGKQRLEFARRMRDLCVDRMDYVRGKEQEDAKDRGFERLEDYYQQRLAEKMYAVKFSIRRIHEDELGLLKNKEDVFNLQDEKLVQKSIIERLKKHPGFSKMVNEQKVEDLIHLPGEKMWKMVSEYKKKMDKINKPLREDIDKKQIQTEQISKSKKKN